MTAADTTVRVHAATRDKARAIATHQQRTIPDLLGELVERESDRLLLEQHNAAIGALDPAGRASWSAEVSALDDTLMDGLRGL